MSTWNLMRRSCTRSIQSNSMILKVSLKVLRTLRDDDGGNLLAYGHISFLMEFIRGMGNKFGNEFYMHIFRILPQFNIITLDLN
jgi:hypothetical protein